MKKQAVIICCSVLISCLNLFGVSAITAGERDGVSHDTIKIGIIADMTGPTISLQLPAVNAVRAYFRNVNEHGGINGRKVQLSVEDDRYTVPMHVSAFRKLVYEDKVFMIIEIGSTAGISAAMTECEKAKVPSFFLSTSKMFVEPPRPYHFTIGASYEDEIKAIFAYLFKSLKLKDPKLALVRAFNDHGEVGSRAVKEQVKVYGIRPAIEEIISPAAVEAASQVSDLKRVKADHVILHLTIANCIPFLRDAKKLGLNATFIGTKYTCMEKVVRKAGEAAQNFYATSSFASWNDDGPGAKKMREVSIRYYPGTKKAIPSKIWVQGWAMALIIHEGLERAGKDITRNGLIKAWEGIKDFDMQGLSANATFGPNKHQCSEYCKVYKADVKNGRLVPVTDWIK